LVDGIRVEKVDAGFLVTYAGALAGQDVPELFWDLTGTNTLVPAPDTSVDVHVTTGRPGTAAPVFANNVQTLTLSGAAAETFKLKVLGVWTDAIRIDATADQILAILQPILDPDNSD